MFNVKDLNIQADIIPFFDFALNDYSKNALENIFRQPLQSIEEIITRQKTLKGFISNFAILKSYSYSRIEFLETNDFLNDLSNNGYSKRELKRSLLFSSKQVHYRKSRSIQLVLLFHKLQSFYFSRINTDHFPLSYKNELAVINDFLSNFNLNHYELLIKENNFKKKHIIELHELVSDLAKKGKVERFWNAYYLFEAYLSISFGIVKYGFCFPVFKEKSFSLYGFYHPLLANPVKNNFISRSNISLITGPNMSGKSTLLKAIGLCVYLGHLGIGIPATNAEMPFYNSIFISINLYDDIKNGYSHFKSELINLKNVVVEAKTHGSSFAVFDELFRGTNMEDSVNISATTIKGLLKLNNSLFLISTHLNELKNLEEVQNKKVSTFFINCELQNNIPRFDYTIKEGWSEIKVGSILFNIEGLNDLLK